MKAPGMKGRELARNATGFAEIIFASISFGLLPASLLVMRNDFER
jgi:hypothetical protein